MHKIHHHRYWCQSGTFSPLVARHHFQGMRRKNMLFFFWVRLVPWPPLGLEAILKDSVVHVAFPLAVSPVALAASGCSHLSLGSCRILRLLAVGIMCCVHACCCMSTPFPSVEFSLQISLQLSPGNATFPLFSCYFPLPKIVCVFPIQPSWNPKIYH